MAAFAYIAVILASYLLGSIPTGFLVAKGRGIDIRTVGSGNIGATNVFRYLGKPAGVFVLLMDAFKGWVAVVGLARVIAMWLDPSADAQSREWLAIVAGISAILGHNYTCWLQFKGGKGIATSAGVLAALMPTGLLIALGIWIVVLAVSRYVSLASMVAAFSLPFAAWVTRSSVTMIGVAGGMGALAIYKHKTNIRRLLSGTESRIGGKAATHRGAGVGAMKITVLGAGAWGTALARLLLEGENEVTLWGHDAEHLAEIGRSRRNERYLPGIEISEALALETALRVATARAELIVVAVPSKAFREVTRELAGFAGMIVSVTKGIEHDTGLTMCGILEETAPDGESAALSGPSFAIEVARGFPTAIVAAGRGAAVAEKVQKLFNRPTFRVYASTDLLGVELGGALKNVITIAAGIGDGLGFGDNAKAAVVTRAVAEIRRLGVACGAQADTFTGLSGLGDLMVTCFSRHSRNRAFGERVGRGEQPADIAASMPGVAEGYPTAASAWQLARERGVVTPVIDETYSMLYEGKEVRRAVRDLMTRDLKAED